jgi:hypothetical protein
MVEHHHPSVSAIVVAAVGKQAKEEEEKVGIRGLFLPKKTTFENVTFSLSIVFLSWYQQVPVQLPSFAED